MQSQLCAPRQIAVRSAFVVSIAAALLLAPAVVMAETNSPQVTSSITSSIMVEGNRRIEADTIRSYFHVRPGGRLDAAAMDAALKDLLASGLFQDVRMRSHAGYRVGVSFVEKPVVYRGAVEGQNKVEEDQTREAVQ